MTLTPQALGSLCKDQPLSDIIGQAAVKDALKGALIMGRHVIIAGPPGIGKTTLVKNLAGLLPPLEVAACDYHCLPLDPRCPSCLSKRTKGVKTIKGVQRFVRIQGSPDLTAEDLLGDIDPVKALEYGPLSVEAFTPGKIFKANNGILFFDEVNRCSEKLQNALLQVLEERKVTIGSYDIDFDANFIFIGTMNPSDNSTEPLSDVFLDRFDIVRMGYPESQRIEEDIVKAKAKRFIEVPDEITVALVRFVRSLREDEKLEKVPSVRASIGLYERAQSGAYLAGRGVVTFFDLGNAIESVIAHRIRLKPSAQFVTTPEDFVKKAYDKFLETTHNSLGGDG